MQGQQSLRPEGEYHSQFRPQYSTHPSPVSISAPGNTHIHQTPNSYSAPQNPSPHPVHTPNYAPSHDGLPRTGPTEQGVGVEASAAQQKRTRTRPTKSCERCRSKKLKCDREFPCGNCKKGGRDGRDCFYRDGWEGDERVEEERAFKRVRVGDAGPNTGSGGANGGRLGVVETMVRIGEAMGGASAAVEPNSDTGGFGQGQPFWAGSIATSAGRIQGETAVSTPPSWTTSIAAKETLPPPGSSSHPTLHTLGHIGIKGSKTRYISPGDKMGIMDHVGHSICLFCSYYTNSKPSFKNPRISSSAALKTLNSFILY